MAEPEKEETAWERGWIDHEMRQLKRLSRLSLPQKLAWLEQAQRVADHLSRRRLGRTAKP